MDVLGILQSWINEVAEEYIEDPYRQGFVHMAQAFTTTFYSDNKSSLCATQYQLCALSGMFASSCLMASAPFSISVLRDLCVECYTEATIIGHVRTLLSSLCVSTPPKNVSFVKQLAVHDYTEVDLVRMNGHLYVRKRICKCLFFVALAQISPYVVVMFRMRRRPLR